MISDSILASVIGSEGSSGLCEIQGVYLSLLISIEVTCPSRRAFFEGEMIIAGYKNSWKRS